MLEVAELSKTFDTRGRSGSERVGAVKDISFTVEQGQLFTLLGPSGCGKTTTLRCIAGLERPDSGSIQVGDRVVYSSKHHIRVPASERRLGVVFQSYAIWPHMSVFKNVSFPLEVLPRRERPKRTVLTQRVERALEAVQLGALAGRPATDLSGGQQQRLALARALVLEPPLMLLDEPLSNLDAKLREGMRVELKRLQRELNITTIYVTHDQIEALAMSNMIGVMKDGSLQQVASPRDIYQRPATRFVADFVGSSNFISATVVGKKPDGTVTLATDGGELRATVAEDLVDTAVVVSVRPEQVSLTAAVSGAPAAGRWNGTVESRIFVGDAFDYIIRVGELEVHARTNPSTNVAEGAAVTIAIPTEACYVIPLEKATTAGK